jgi:2-polyprenyl-3-methyl-5-hydroxy-6-metoxy-1,4-benzoquinol methylase
VARRASTSYGRFATYYDFIYHDLVNYQGDVDFLEATLRRRLRRLVRTILDLGCGTGNHDLPLASRGYRVTGLDLSASQLVVARRKARKAEVNVDFVQGDMRSFALLQSFDAAICMFGAFGYLTKSSVVLHCLQTLRCHLTTDGLFVYEFWNTLAVHPQQSWLDKIGGDCEVVRLSEGKFNR